MSVRANWIRQDLFVCIRIEIISSKFKFIHFNEGLAPPQHSQSIGLSWPTTCRRWRTCEGLENKTWFVNNVRSLREKKFSLCCAAHWLLHGCTSGSLFIIDIHTPIRLIYTKSSLLTERCRAAHIYKFASHNLYSLTRVPLNVRIAKIKAVASYI